jgi:hypothetical protein
VHLGRNVEAFESGEVGRNGNPKTQTLDSTNNARGFTIDKFSHGSRPCFLYNALTSSDSTAFFVL